MLLNRSELGAQLSDESTRDAFRGQYGSSLGTMLPFQTQGLATSRVTHSMPKIFHTDVVDHPSVSSWHICGDGSVRMLEAGIYLSSPSEKKLGVIAGHIFPRELVLSLRPELEVHNEDNTCDLDVALRVLAGDGQAHAVTLYTEHIMNCGVILWGPSQDQTKTQYFVKVGVYDAGSPEDVLPILTKTSTVDWVVL